MKYLKMLGVAALAAAALMAFAGPASATSFTSPAGTIYTGQVKGESNHLVWHGSFISLTCTNSAFSANVENHGASVTAGGKITSLSFNGCNYPFTVRKPGSLEVHTDTAAVDGNGTLTWSGLELAMHTSVGECVFTTAGTDFGTVTGSDTGAAQWDINSIVIPRTGGSFFCGSTATVTGSYTITTPSTLTVD
jgi:hypothetical protein